MSTPLVAGVVARPVRPGRREGGTSSSWYRESAPAEDVRAAVVARWHGVGGWDRSLRVLPDGCADLIWADDRLLVVGAHPGPQRFDVPAASHNVGLRLRPGAAGAVLGLPLDELPSGAVPGVDLWGDVARRLEDELHHAPDAATRHHLLERHVAERHGTIDPAVVAAARLLRRPDAGVAEVAGAVGLSPRELRRRFLAQVGYGPKALQRVLRFRAFLRDITAPATGTGTAAADGVPSLADAAARHGYADQSHLGRECRRLSGSSPARLATQART